MRECPFCDGTGFRDGKVCTCISKPKEKGEQGLPPEFKEVFGGVFGDIFKDKE